MITLNGTEVTLLIHPNEKGFLTVSYSQGELQRGCHISELQIDTVAERDLLLIDLNKAEQELRF